MDCCQTQGWGTEAPLIKNVHVQAHWFPRRIEIWSDCDSWASGSRFVLACQSSFSRDANCANCGRQSTWKCWWNQDCLHFLASGVNYTLKLCSLYSRRKGCSFVVTILWRTQMAAKPNLDGVSQHNVTTWLVQIIVHRAAGCRRTQGFVPLDCSDWQNSLRLQHRPKPVLTWSRYDFLCEWKEASRQNVIKESPWGKLELIESRRSNEGKKPNLSDMVTNAAVS